MPVYSNLHFEPRYDNTPSIPSWWRTGVEDVLELVSRTERGEVEELARTPGDRAVHLISYGEPEPGLRGSANFNSSHSARSPESYYRKTERTRPVILLFAGSHGHETEGVAAVLSVIRIMETGLDLRGTSQARLRELLDRCRVLLVPLANPDGRARMPYQSVIGLPNEEMHRVGQGTRADGSLWGWPACKTNHPMIGDVGIPGAYYDDNGVNLAHDEWVAPMSPVTDAIQRLIREEGPDLALNLHGHEAAHGFHLTPYLPRDAEARARQFMAGAAAFCADRSIDIHAPDSPAIRGLNQTAMWYHLGASISLTFEACQGLCDCGPDGITPDGTLDVLHALFEYSTLSLLEI